MNNKFLLNLIKSSVAGGIAGGTLPSISDHPDWSYLYQKSLEQNITGLIYSAIQKLDNKDEIPSEIMTAFNTGMLTTVTTTTRQYAEFTVVNNIMREKGILFIGLKGCVLRNMYPTPELRTMGDFDMLVRGEDLPAIKQIFRDRGYEIEKDANGIVCTKGLVHWEIFTTIGEEFTINTKKWDKAFFSNLTELYGITCPTPTYFFLHLMIHTGKHLLGKGAGIRNLCDIALFLQNYKDEIDFSLVEEACREQGYFKVYEYLMAVMAQAWGIGLNMQLPERDVDALIDYMLLYGIYGKNDNTIVSQLIRRKNENDSLVHKLFFPSVEVLKNRYKYLKKYPFLLPFAWVHRFFSGVFRLKYSVRQMVGDVADANSFAKDRLQRLRELDLMDKID